MLNMMHSPTYANFLLFSQNKTLGILSWKLLKQEKMRKEKTDQSQNVIGSVCWFYKIILTLHNRKTHNELRAKLHFGFGPRVWGIFQVQ